MSPTIQYASFLVRLWREESGDPSAESVDWQSEVEHVQTGERWAFDTLEELLVFLPEATGKGTVRATLEEK